MTHTPILIIDDNQSHLTLYSAILNDAGFSTVTAATVKEALEVNRQTSPQIALVDLMLPDGSGHDLISQLYETNPNLKPIVTTAYASIDRAVEAMRMGVSDFLVKPINPQILVDAIINARSGGSQTLRPNLGPLDAPPLGGLLGSSAEMKQIYATMRAVSGSDASVFITGENGTGKTMCAKAIHALSPDTDGPFVAVHCGSRSAAALGAELFGRGSAVEPHVQKSNIGALQKADGGTLFLDEICDLDAVSQAQLLEFLKTSNVTPNDSAEPIPVKTRIICASSKSPLDCISAGKLRADLYYRLFVVPIHLPPLRDRGLDVIEIAEAMVARYAAKENKPTPALSKDTKALLLSYAWPGNIHELMNVLWNCVVVNTGPMIEEHHLPKSLLDTFPRPQETTTPSFSLGDVVASKSLLEIEREIIEFAINRAGGSIPKASKALDVSPSTIYRKLETWGRPARGPRRQ
ncbi:two component Fis family sigma54 specific transcriptional regulator [Pacificibacter maritimus]|uniref:Two component Fis family sigma54 specific transcriptional regulator n=1 Tax=Pacificibacter maritimus TaxID=762213 RepID=A0A3N4UGH5_9RHOB|nr:sigma-54 dependent transcriptional regulator [Pacificibacter maritimus]RPE66341.1 two component Fis family sigma54 specific transcriptional regulator [Pacificibacter maritimus]